MKVKRVRRRIRDRNEFCGETIFPARDTTTSETVGQQIRCVPGMSRGKAVRTGDVDSLVSGGHGKEQLSDSATPC